MLKQVRYQETAVNELVSKTIKLLNSAGQRKKLVFKAPTGSGKTVMASEMLGRLVSELPERTDCNYDKIALIWIAPNKLHEQSYFKMKNFFTETRILQPLIYDELDHSSESYIQHGEILFVNWESINKDNAVMIRETENSASLYDITRRTQEDNHIPIVVVIDEEHMFGTKNAKKCEKVLQNINPKLEIRISATPITKGDEMVNVLREDVIAEEMIKSGIVLNPAIDVARSDGLTANQWLIKEALNKRNELAAAYRELGVGINPLLLIQLPNDSSEANTAEDNTIKEEVIEYLRAMHDITTDNGKLAVWLSNEKENLANLEAPDNLTEVLLFKQAIALGWDCPRASVLLIFRKLDSFTFTMQTIGRILRMPEQKYYSKEALNMGYVYTDLSKDKIQIVKDDLDYISKLTARRRANLNNVKLQSVYVERKGTDRMRLGTGFKTVLKEQMAKGWTKIYEPSLFDLFGDDDSPEPFSLDSKAPDNRAAASKYINFNVKSISIDIPKDLPILNELGIIEVNSKVKFARTESELKRVFDDFCLKQLTEWEKHQSLAMLENAIEEAMESLFDVFETDVKKIVLYHGNRPKFVEIIHAALNAYKQTMNMRRKASERDLISYEWEVPEERVYNEQVNCIDDTKKNHALLPFIASRNASYQELNFSEFLERNTQYIDWWYKNGDNGIMNYAIPYKNVRGEQALFYVDYVIRMKNGQIFLFDTKSQNSDENAPNKHNALWEYMKSDENSDLGLKGGVLIFDHENWKYSPLPISDTDDLTGWDCFYPEQYEQ